jgi:hypothetical protein
MPRKGPAIQTWLIVLTLVACWPAPGKGPNADAGYQHAAPVIAALEQFHAAHGSYPDSLRQLVPNFLPDSALQSPPDWSAMRALHYRLSVDSYELSFWYSGPGSNTCTYTPESRRWRCSGLI